jgi:hypothetical protein
MLQWALCHYAVFLTSSVATNAFPSLNLQKGLDKPAPTPYNERGKRLFADTPCQVEAGVLDRSRSSEAGGEEVEVIGMRQ